MNFFKLPFKMFLICLLLLITTSMDANNVIPVSDTKEKITEDFDVNEFLSQISDDEEDMLAENSAPSQIGLEWFYAKTPLQQKNVWEAMKISFKAYKNCDSLQMKKEMEKSPYYLEDKQTEQLCEYFSRELKHDNKMAYKLDKKKVSIGNYKKLKDLKRTYKLDKTENKTKAVLNADIISLVGDYVQENSDVLNLAMTNKKNKNMILESRKRDEVDPIRYFVKTVSPQLLRYLDGTELFQFNESKKRKLFDDVQIIFTPQQVIDGTNIESVLKEHASDLYAYIQNKTEYDPETHFGLYDKYTQKMQSGCIGHQGFALKHGIHEEGLPIGTWYTEKQCTNLSYQNSRPGGRTIDECVMKCKRDSNCTACTIGSSFHFWKMVMRPAQCILGPRETYHHMSAWIKDDGEAKPNTKAQEYARNNKYLGRLISEYVNDKLDGYAPPTLLN